MTEREREVLTILESQNKLTSREKKRLEKSGRRSQPPFSKESKAEAQRRMKTR